MSWEHREAMMIPRRMRLNPLIVTAIGGVAVVVILVTGLLWVAHRYQVHLPSWGCS